jgi:hypothetical protein
MKPAGDTALSIGTKWPVVLHALSTCRPRTSEAKFRQCVEISGFHRRKCVANAPCYRPTLRSSGCQILFASEMLLLVLLSVLPKSSRSLFYASAPAWMRDTQDLGPTETSLSTAATFIPVSPCEA